MFWNVDLCSPTKFFWNTAWVLARQACRAMSGLSAILALHVVLYRSLQTLNAQVGQAVGTCDKTNKATINFLFQNVLNAPASILVDFSIFQFL